MASIHRRGTPLDLIVDPTVDIRSSIPDVFAQAESRWAAPAVPPVVNSRHEHVQVRGELARAEETLRFGHAHAAILGAGPFDQRSRGLPRRLRRSRARRAAGSTAKDPPEGGDVGVADVRQVLRRGLRTSTEWVGPEV